MSNEPRKKVKIEKLELNKETVADLTGEEAEGVEGGLLVSIQCTGDCEAMPGTLYATCACPSRDIKCAR